MNESITSAILTGNYSREDIAEAYSISLLEEVENIEERVREALEDTQISEIEFQDICDSIDADYTLQETTT